MKIGVYICQCGINIAATVDVEKVAEYANTLPSVEVARFYKYMCSDPGQELIKKDIKEMKLDRVVVASCSPRMHEPTFRVVLEEMGMALPPIQATQIAVALKDAGRDDLAEDVMALMTPNFMRPYIDPKLLAASVEALSMNPQTQPLAQALAQAMGGGMPPY